MPKTYKVKVNVTTEDGEVLEQLVVVAQESGTVRSTAMLGRLVTRTLEKNAQFSEVEGG